MLEPTAEDLEAFQAFSICYKPGEMGGYTPNYTAAEALQIPRGVQQMFRLILDVYREWAEAEAAKKSNGKGQTKH